MGMGTIVFVDTGLTSVTGGENQSRPGREQIGAQLIAACCEEVGWKVRYLTPNTDNAASIREDVLRGEHNVVAFSPYTYTAHIADAAAELLKGRSVIVYGGYHFGCGDMPERTLAEGRADYIITGRGEDALPQLLKELEAGGKTDSLRVIQAPHNCLDDEPFPLDRLPWPIRRQDLLQDTTVEHIPFLPPTELTATPRWCAIVAGAIGCKRRCDFCLSWKMTGGRVLHRSPTNVVDELVSLRKRFGDGIIHHLVNPLFNADRNWVMTLCAEMEKRGPFPTIVMPDFNLDREMVGAMKRAGIYMAMMGLEFASDQLRVTRGKRRFSPQRAFDLCAEAGIITRAFYMLGRLGMTRADLDDEIQQLESLPFRADQLRINLEVPFPGTARYQALQPGDTILPYSHWTTEKVVYRTDLTEAEWQERRHEIHLHYHSCPRQQSHYERQVSRHPELGPVYQDFLTRLKTSLETD